MENNTSSNFKSKLTTKLITLFLTILIIFFAVPSIVYVEAAEALSGLGGEEKSADELPFVDSYTKESDIYEVTSLREENVKHFRLEDGSYIAAQYPTAVHISDGEGGWIDIDNSLHAASGEIASGDGRIKLSKKITGNGNLFTLHNGNKKITLALLGAKKGVSGEVTNYEDAENETKLQKMMHLENLSSSVIYRDILEGVDLEYKLNGSAIKENIIIKEKGGNYSYSFELSLNGLSATLTEDGSVSLLDETGTVSYVIPAPVIFDANENYGSASYTLSQKNGNGKYTLTATANAEWMNAEERAFPVTLDPAICPVSSSVTALHISSNAPSFCFDNYSYMSVYSTDTVYWKTSDISFIPKRAYISSAILTVRSYSSSSGYIGVHLVNSAWDNTLKYEETQGTNPSGAINSEIISYIYASGAKNTYFDFNITEAVQYWQNDQTLNYGIALKYIQGGRSYFYPLNSTTVQNRPCLKVSYTNHNGLESYNSYSSHNVGGVASGNVNLATGSLVMDIPLLSQTSGILPYTLSLTYDSSRANVPFYYGNSNVPYNFVTAPYGYKWSVQQSVVKVAYSNEIGEIKYLYIWCDADGTEHSFFEGETAGIYEDNDGLGLKLRESSVGVTITSKDKISYTFTAVAVPTGYVGAWNLSSIKDKNGNKLVFASDSISRKPVSVKFLPNGNNTGWEIIKFVYDSTSNVPRAVYDPLTYRGIVFSYSDATDGTVSASATKYLRCIKYVTGNASTNWQSLGTEKVIASLEIEYSNNGFIGSALETVSDTGISYSFLNSKVRNVVELNSAAVGQRLVFAYGMGYTDVCSSGSDDVYGTADDLITRNIFDSYGRVVSTYSRNQEGSRIYNAVLGEYETQENVKNSIKEVTDAGEGAVNLLINGGFEDGSDGLEYWTKSSNATIDNAGADRPKSRNKVRFSLSASNSACIYQIANLTYGAYIISFDVSSASARGVSLGVKITNLSNNSVQNFQFAKDEYPTSANEHVEEAIRVSKSFTVTSEARYKIELYANADSTASGANVYLDNVMLSLGGDMASYNMVDFAGFERKACDASQNLLTIETRWTLSGAAGTSSAAALLGNSMRLYSANISSVSSATQRIYKTDGIAATSEKKFIVSGYGKSTNAILSNNSFFEIRVNVKYKNSDVEINSYKFNPSCTDWQFVSGSFTTKANEEIEYIDVACVFAGQIDASAYFDKIFVIDATDYNRVKYEYYENGNLKTATDYKTTEYYRYDENDNLIAKANTSRVLYQYFYDSRGNLIEERVYDYQLTGGDSEYTEYPVDAANPDALITKRTLLSTIYVVNGYGLIILETTGAYNNSGVLEAYSLETSYTYDTGSQMFFGALKTKTDTLGNVTRYFYEFNGTEIITAAIEGGTGTGTATYTDVWGRVEKALPVVNGTSTGYTAEMNAESVEYDYNAKNQLSTITTDSTTYTFTYDVYGNQSVIKAGSNNLATYSYNANNGKLKTVTYGNGFVIEYFYNDLENISEIWYTVGGTASVAYIYSYTESGLLHSVEDVRNGKTTVYNYDSNGRLAKVLNYSTADMSSDGSDTYIYNSDGAISNIYNTLTYKVDSASYEKTLVTAYTYDSYKRLSVERINSTQSSYIDTAYTYDSFHRVSGVRVVFSEGGFDLNIDYTFSTNGTQTSAQVKTYKSTVNGTQTLYSYTYDTKGNITAVSINGTERNRYAYDNLGQLIREDNIPKNQTCVYTYDKSGNITSKKTYALTAKDVTPSGNCATVIYGYSSGAWGDLLTSYGGSTITYDAIGNPLRYGNYTFTWEGRRLVGVTSSSKTMSFTYNDEGIRTSKTVNGVTTNYYLSGSQIVAEETNGNITVYLYNSTGVIGFQYHASTYAKDVWDTYFYEKNVQGDIVAVYNTSGTKLISYTYDAWGKFTATYHNNATSSTLKHAFLYRGYYFDMETGFYLTGTRYYDPEIGRFISPDTTDVITATPMALTDKNLYAYCDNNPVVRADHSGEFWNYVIGGFVGAVVGGVSAAISGGDWKAIALGAGVGAVGGLLAASGVPAGFQIVAGGLLSGGNNLATQTLVEGKSLQEVDWIDVGIDTAIGAGTSALSYGVTRNASKAADKIICKGANKVVKGQQSLLSGSRYGKGAIKKGTAIMNSGIKQMNTVRGTSSVVGSTSGGFLTSVKSFFKRLFR